ncbi:Aste57867_14450 [Aphanomyces stellatus]|uniref:Aste57867_14450 protein n=1 Tax=Aphanomyces stellatus TaxID=120398 RepID=A0A485L2D9_9STRA|nr:hypothetical protein As57867_014396 [Aphanomyces stellatus]VFT91272.1 Aste57867_14450 [Aphanomyces stellatus]
MEPKAGAAAAPPFETRAANATLHVTLSLISESGINSADTGTPATTTAQSTSRGGAAALIVDAGPPLMPLAADSSSAVHPAQLHAALLELHETGPPTNPLHPIDHSRHNHPTTTTTHATKKKPPPRLDAIPLDAPAPPSITALAKEYLPPRSRKKHAYDPFRVTCFTDKALLPVHYDSKLRSTLGTAAEGRRVWATPGPHLGCEPRLDWKTSAMYAPSLDRVYDMTRQSLGYRVHMSMYGSTLWDTTERFRERTATSTRVGPGSYNAAPSAWEKEPHAARPPPVYPYSPKRDKPSTNLATTTTTTAEPYEEVSLESWKLTSERAAAARPAFDKAPRTTWVDWESNKAGRMRKRVLSTPALHLGETMPEFIAGVRAGAPKSPPKGGKKHPARTR